MAVPQLQLQRASVDRSVVDVAEWVDCEFAVVVIALVEVVESKTHVDQSASIHVADLDVEVVVVAAWAFAVEQLRLVSRLSGRHQQHNLMSPHWLAWAEDASEC